MIAPSSRTYSSCKLSRRDVWGSESFDCPSDEGLYSWDTCSNDNSIVLNPVAHESLIS